MIFLLSFLALTGCEVKQTSPANLDARLENDALEEPSFRGAVAGRFGIPEKTGKFRLVIGLVKINGVSPIGPSDAVLRAMLGQVRQEFKRQSWGQVDIEVTGILRNLEINISQASSACWLTTLAARDAVASAATVAGIPYDLRMTIVPPSVVGMGGHCAAAGWAFVNSQDFFVRDEHVKRDTIIHEMQHALGLNHSVQDNGPAYGSYPEVGIGDSGSRLEPTSMELNVPQKVGLGWIPQRQVREIRNSGTFLLASANADPKVNSQLPRLIEVPAGQGEGSYLISCSPRLGVSVHRTLPERYDFRRTFLIGRAAVGLDYSSSTLTADRVSHPLSIHMLNATTSACQVRIHFTQDARTLPSLTPAQSRFVDVFKPRTEGDGVWKVQDAGLGRTNSLREGVETYGPFQAFDENAYQVLRTLRKDFKLSLDFNLEDVVSSEGKVGLIWRFNEQTKDHYLYQVVRSGNSMWGDFFVYQSGQWTLASRNEIKTRQGKLQIVSQGDRHVVYVDKQLVMDNRHSILKEGMPGIQASGSGTKLSNFILE